jgi:hypothetical protein
MLITSGWAAMVAAEEAGAASALAATDAVESVALVMVWVIANRMEEASVSLASIDADANY